MGLGLGLYLEGGIVDEERIVLEIELVDTNVVAECPTKTARVGVGDATSSDGRRRGRKMDWGGGMGRLAIRLLLMLSRRYVPTSCRLLARIRVRAIDCLTVQGLRFRHSCQF